MKKLVVILVMVFLGLAVLPARASDRSAASSQLAISADHTFWQNQDDTLSAYGAGVFVLNLNNGYAFLDGYMGAKVNLDKISVYLLGVTFNDPFGWSAGPSMWLEYNGANNYFFTQYDYNCPFMSTVHKENPALMGEDPPLPLHTYYTFSQYKRILPDNTGVGMALETFGDYERNKPVELAYGPFVDMGQLRLWLYKNDTPQTDGYEYWGLRFQLKL